MERMPQVRGRDYLGPGSGVIVPPSGVLGSADPTLPQRADEWLAAHRTMVDAGVVQRARIVARLLGGGRVSGQRLASELGVSRAAVHKHADVLRGLGVPLSSIPGVGYELLPPFDILAPEVVLPLLASRAPSFGGPYLFHAEIGSTNVVAQEAARGGAPHGALAVTDFQSSGRGRLGRGWTSEPGLDLTFSIVLRPDCAPQSVSRLTLAAGVAVADTILALGDLDGRVTVKWPNDVLIDGRKVCGILSEAALDMDRLHWVVVGIGLNVNGTPASGVALQELPPGAPLPISLREARGTFTPRTPLLVELLAALSSVFASVEGEAWDRALGRLRALDALRGQRVDVRARVGGGYPVLSGVADGLASDGSLRVRDDSGALHEVVSGDVTLRADST